MKKVPEINFSESIISPLKIQVVPLKSLKSMFEESMDHNPFQPHRLKFNAIFFILKGKEGIHQIDFEDYHYKSGSLILIAKEQIHCFVDLPARNEGFLLLFTEEIFLEISRAYPYLINQLYDDQLYSPIIDLESEAFKEIHSLILKIKKELSNSGKSVWMELAKSYLKIVLLELFSWRESGNNKMEKNPYLKEFINFKLLLQEYKYKEKKVQFYAKKLNVTPKKLNIITQASVHLSAKDFILSAVILEAKKYLKCSDLSTKEVAYTLGFEEPTNFTKFFKKHTNMLPSEFAQLT